MSRETWDRYGKREEGRPYEAAPPLKLPERGLLTQYTQEEFNVPYEVGGRPHPREAKSQKAQLNSVHRHETNKDVKVEMMEKQR